MTIWYLESVNESGGNTCKMHRNAFTSFKFLVQFKFLNSCLFIAVYWAMRVSSNQFHVFAKGFVLNLCWWKMDETMQ